MAAPQWTGGKSKSLQHAKAMFRHDDPEQRKEHEHTNPHVGASSAENNFNFRGRDYAGMCRAYDKRMSEIDQGKGGTGKNARVVMQSVILYPPAGLTDEVDMVRWFKRAGEILQGKYGDNLIELSAHFDEQHEYRDEAGQLVRSRPHAHANLVPEVGGKLNAKQFSSRARMVELNNELQEMSIREFNTPMMDGSKAKGGRPVEQLKAESRGREIIAKAEEKAELQADLIRGKAHLEAVQISSEATSWAKRHTEAAEARIKATEDAAAAEGRKQAGELIKAAQDALRAAQGHLQACKDFRLDAEQKEQARKLQEEQQRQRDEVAAARQKAGNIRDTGDQSRSKDFPFL